MAVLHGHGSTTYLDPRHAHDSVSIHEIDVDGEWGVCAVGSGVLAHATETVDVNRLERDVQGQELPLPSIQRLEVLCPFAAGEDAGRAAPSQLAFVYGFVVAALERSLPSCGKQDFSQEQRLLTQRRLEWLVLSR